MRWFHKEDGGPMIAFPKFEPKPGSFDTWYLCRICGYVADDPRSQGCVRLSNLSEDLQAVALSELL